MGVLDLDEAVQYELAEIPDYITYEQKEETI